MERPHECSLDCPSCLSCADRVCVDDHIEDHSIGHSKARGSEGGFGRSPQETASAGVCVCVCVCVCVTVCV